MGLPPHVIKPNTKTPKWKEISMNINKLPSVLIWLATLLLAYPAHSATWTPGCVPPFERQDDLEASCGRTKRCCPNRCHLGSAGFSTTSAQSWYTINTLPYPTTVPLSLNRNQGFTEGKVELTPTGLLIREPGNYSISFSAILQNNDPEYTALIPVFVSLNEAFDPLDIPVGSVVALPTGLVNTVHGTGILHQVKAGTTISLIATNGGSPQPQAIHVVAWNMSLFKIPCGS